MSPGTVIEIQAVDVRQPRQRVQLRNRQPGPVCIASPVSPRWRLWH